MQTAGDGDGRAAAEAGARLRFDSSTNGQFVYRAVFHIPWLSTRAMHCVRTSMCHVCMRSLDVGIDSCTTVINHFPHRQQKKLRQVSVNDRANDALYGIRSAPFRTERDGVL
jgi:hypothetical protein